MSVRRVGLVAAFVVAMIVASVALADRGGPQPTAAPVTTLATARFATTTPAVSPPVATTTPPAALVPIGVPAEPHPQAPAPSPAIDGDFAGLGVVTIATGGADLVPAPGATPFVRAREGLVFAAQAIEGEWIRIMTTCDTEAWVNVAEVRATTQVPASAIGSGFTLDEAVVVVDAGHGGPNIGTSSPDGSLVEKVVNADIARRLRDLLEAPHTVDWQGGTIFTGDDIPAARRVILTRVGADDSADYEAGLIYRASLANAAGAHVMVSIHNNAGWEVALDHPGSDVYYQSQVSASRRLAELLVEEFHRSFAQFDADWVGAIEWGAKSRLSPRDEVSQYYGILRRAVMPTVIAEGAYLANETEAALLRTPEFRQAYAEAAYRAVVRFLTTDEVAEIPSYDPVVWAGFAGSGDPVSTCAVPAQSD